MNDDGMSNLPTLYEAVRRDLVSLKELVEIKEVRDKAIGLEGYARAAKDGALLGEAVRVRKWSTRRLGERMAEKREAGELPEGRPKKRVGENPVFPTLASQGVDKILADSARKAAALDDDAFRDAVERAVAMAIAAIESVTTAEKRERRQKREEDLGAKQTALPQKRYGVIYADPPWKFEVYSEDTGQGRTAESHYPTMAQGSIAEIPVASIAADDCVLFMWTTAPTMPEAFDLLKAWGFTYRSQCVWAKDKIGLGFWFRNQHEILIVAVKGSVPAPAHGTQWSSLIHAPRGKHSEKPAIFYELIEHYFPTLPKIELFARAGRPRWDCWGNQAPVATEAAE